MMLQGMKGQEKPREKYHNPREKDYNTTQPPQQPPDASSGLPNCAGAPPPPPDGMFLPCSCWERVSKGEDRIGRWAGDRGGQVVEVGR